MSTDTSAPAGARNATLADLAALLRDQQARKADIVAPATAIRAQGARLVVAATDPVLGPDGVTMTTGTYTPTEVCDQGIADKLGIPAGYLRRLREHKPGLYDANVNAWLDADDRRFLLHCLYPATGRGRGRCGRSCPTGTRSSTTWTCCWPSWTASASPVPRSRSTGVT